MSTDSRTHTSLVRTLMAATFAFAIVGAPSAAYEAHAACVIPPAGDADCDGLADGDDPCPGDTLNRCNAPIATCATAPPGAQECAVGVELRLDLGATAPVVDCRGDVWSADLGGGLRGGVAGARA